MIRTIIESNALLYACAAVGLLGILCQFLISRRYTKLIREASDTRLEKKDFMKQLRMNYRTERKCSNESVNIPLFVRRQLLDYRFWRLNFHQWKRLAAGFFIVSLMAAAAGLIFCFRGNFSDTYMQNILWTAAGVTAGTALAGLWTDLSYKSLYLEARLEDYLFHSGAALDRPETEAENAVVSDKQKKRMPVMIGTRKKAEVRAETNAQREKRELKKSLARIKDGMRESAADAERERNRELLRQMDTKEQERIIRDVLAEFLA